MSDTALEEYKRAREAQLTRNEVRRIQTRVKEARSENSGADVRWPFELTQNALDAGMRTGRSDVSIDITFDGTRLTYAHDGQPFTIQDLAALLSGGSNKEFESEQTTGRFGTGFLVTHVLSAQIDIDGILLSEGRQEQFALHLDRSGDEDQIFANTIESYEAIRGAHRVDSPETSTAKFSYVTDNPAAARAGIRAYSVTALYLYGTCESLGQIQISDDHGNRTVWRPTRRCVVDRSVATVADRTVWVEANAGPPREYRVLRFVSKTTPAAILIFVLKKVGDEWTFDVPPTELPRMFFKFPIRGGDFLPIDFVIDGHFDVSQERDRVLMRESDRLQIAAALAMLPDAVQWAKQLGCSGTHRMARVAMPLRSFNLELSESDRKWWGSTLTAVATALAAMPIVRTAGGDLPAIAVAEDQSTHADFVLPRVDLESQDELPLERVWRLATWTDDADPPVAELAEEWSNIAGAWATLAVTPSMVTLSELADKARRRGPKLADLAVKVSPREWLSEYFDLVGQVADKHNWSAAMRSLIPNQNEVLRSPSDSLFRDGGIPAPLKDLSRSLGKDTRDALVDLELLQMGQGVQPHAAKLLEMAVPAVLTEDSVLKTCLAELDARLPSGKAIPEQAHELRSGSVRFLQYLWDTRGDAGAELAQQCPVITGDNTASRWDHQKRIMAPASTWNANAQEFSAVYAPARILSEEYVLEGDQKLVDALVRWGMAFPDPLTVDKPRELKEARLAAISVAGSTDGVSVSEQQFSQVALLPTEVIQRCAADPNLAQQLLGLVLKHIAPQDASWRVKKPIIGHRGTDEVELELILALWLADLKTKAWVPVAGEDGIEQVMAHAGNLGPLLKREWLIENDAAIELLTTWFGFNILELRLLSMTENDESRARLEAVVAKVVQAVGADAAEYESLATEILERRKRAEEKERNRRFGLAVQGAIEKCLRERGLDLDLIDDGYDYDIFIEGIPALETGTQHFRLGDYLLEVKATTSGEVRLTPNQARTAADERTRFVLCVVDLRGIGLDRVAGDWNPADVEPLAHFVTGLGNLTAQTCSLVDLAKEETIGIRNDIALRYGISIPLWEAGISLDEWVNLLVARTSNSGTMPGSHT
jgi:hypothetical protein